MVSSKAKSLSQDRRQNVLVLPLPIRSGVVDRGSPRPRLV